MYDKNDVKVLVRVAAEIVANFAEEDISFTLGDELDAALMPFRKKESGQTIRITDPRNPNKYDMERLYVRNAELVLELAKAKKDVEFYKIGGQDT